MSNLLNTNIGPERVEVIPQPTGSVQVPGAATAITAFLLRSDLAGAPVDVPTSVTNLEAAVAQFGDETNMGADAFYALRGFFSNAGTGSQAIIVNVSPTSSGSNVSARGVAENGGGGFIEDDNVIVSSLAISGYVSGTGVLSLSGTPDLSEVQAGDFFKDDNGRLFLISAVDDTADTLTIPTGLVTLAGASVHSAGGLNVGSTAGKVLRLFSADEFNSQALIQEGSSKGSVSITSASGITANASAGGFFNIGSNVGDILVDSASAVFYITAVVDDDQVLLDRAGVANGAATVLAADIHIISDTKRTASSTASASPGVAFSSSGAGFGILPTSVSPYPVGSLNSHFATIASVSNEVLSQTIIASGSLDSNFGTSAVTLTYNSSTGVISFAGAQNLSTVVAGDVWRDASNNDFIINAVDDAGDKITIAPDQTVNTSAGSTIRRGQARVNFVDTSYNPGTSSTPVFYQPADELDFASSENGLASAYFIADPVVQDSDFAGDAANGKGLHALDTTDDVNLICIPGITSRSVQNALIDYCETVRNDCFALLMIPQHVRKAAVDTVLASISISSIANGPINSTLSLSGTPNLLSVSVGDLLDFNGTKYLIVDVDQSDNKVTVQSSSITGSGAASLVSPSAISYKEVVVNNPSKRAAWYYNHVKVLRSSDSAILTVDPIGHVAGVMARIDANISIGGVSRAPAGIGPAGLADTVDLDLAISENQEGGPLRLNFINRITQFPGAGRIIFGAYTADSGTSPASTAEEQLIQVIRTNLFIKKSLERGLRAFIWDNFSPITQFQAKNAILSFLRNNSYLFPAGRPENEQFQVIAVEPTSDDLAKGLMKFRLLVSTNVSVRFMEIALEFPIPQFQS